MAEHLTGAESAALHNVGITTPDLHRIGTIGWLNAKDRLAVIERLLTERHAAGVAAGRAEAADTIRLALLPDTAERLIGLIARNPTTGLPDASRGPGDANRGAVGLGDSEDENGRERGVQR